MIKMLIDFRYLALLINQCERYAGTGRVNCNNGLEECTMYYQAGKLYHAESIKLAGALALPQLLRWQTGMVTFEPNITTARHSISNHQAEVFQQALLLLQKRGVLETVPASTLTLTIPTLIEQGNRQTALALTEKSWQEGFETVLARPPVLEEDLAISSVIEEQPAPIPPLELAAPSALEMVDTVEAAGVEIALITALPASKALSVETEVINQPVSEAISSEPDELLKPDNATALPENVAVADKLMQFTNAASEKIAELHKLIADLGLSFNVNRLTLSILELSTDLQTQAGTFQLPEIGQQFGTLKALSEALDSSMLPSALGRQMLDKAFTRLQALLPDFVPSGSVNENITNANAEARQPLQLSGLIKNEDFPLAPEAEQHPDFNFDNQAAIDDSPSAVENAGVSFDLENGAETDSAEETSFAFDPKIPLAMVALIASTSSMPGAPSAPEIEPEPEPFAIEFNFEEALLKPVQFNSQLRAAEIGENGEFNFDLEIYSESTTTTEVELSSENAPVALAELSVAPLQAGTAESAPNATNPVEAKADEPQGQANSSKALEFDLEKPQPVVKTVEDFAFEPNIPAAMVALIAATAQPPNTSALTSLDKVTKPLTLFTPTVTSAVDEVVQASANNNADSDFNLDAPLALAETTETDFAFEPKIPVAMVALIASTASQTRRKA